MRLLEDALERALAVPHRPQRIVSLVPSLTELLFDLGAGDRVVGVSRYCTEPAAGLAGIARVGGQKDPDLEAICALGPDLVLAVKEENLARDVEALEARAVAVYVAEVLGVEDALALFGEIGDLVDAEDRTIGALRAAALAAVDEARRRASGRRAYRVFCPVWKDPWIGLSRDTYLADVLRTCGAEAVPEGRYDRRYPKVTLDEVRAAAPDLILLPDEPYAFTEADAAPLRAIAPVRLVEGKRLAWYGRRLAELPLLAALIDEAVGEKSDARRIPV